MATHLSPPADPTLFGPEPEVEFHLSQWIEVLRRRRVLLAVVAATVLAASVVLYFMTPKVFRATTVVQIERRSSNPMVQTQAYFYEDWADSQSFYPTQYRLLQSRGLAERVVKNLRLADDPAFSPPRANLVGGGSAGATAADDARAVAGQAGRVLGGLTVTPIRNTRLVEISYSSANPELAARVANGVAEAFIDWGIETRFATVGKASTFLSSQVEALKQEIQDKEAQLQAYGRRTDIVALDPASNVTLQRLEALNRDYISAVSERINKEAHYKELTSASADAVADTLSAGLVAQLRGDVLRLEREYASKLATYKPEWPAMQDLKAQIDKGRQNLDVVVAETLGKARDAARADYQTALRREQSLTEEMARQKNDAMRLNSAAVEYNNLKVEVSTRRALLDDLVKRLSETEVTSRLQGTRESNILIVDRALVPGGPYRPSLRRNLTLGLVLGLGLGLGAVFFVEYLDRTLKSPDDVDRILRLPVLTVVPDVQHGSDSYGYSAYYGRRKGKAGSSSKKRLHRPSRLAGEDVQIELLPHLQPRLAVSESYRALRTALLLSTADGLKCVVVTSAIPGEGKSSTAINLAVVLAQLGSDVLVVDADLRKPRMHEILSVSNRVGLVNCLTGQVEESQVFLRTGIPNLYVTPAGPLPPNPAELLSSERMQHFVALARQRFNYVVFDTPPALPVTDATVLGAMTDGVVLCVGAGQVLREDALACLERLQLSDVRVLGAVLNFHRAGGRRYGTQYRHYEAYAEASGDTQGRA